MKLIDNCIAYMGHLRKGQGLELIVETLPRIVKEIPDVKLTSDWNWRA